MQKLKSPLICFECGSAKIDYDPVHENKYCHNCGTVLEECAFV